MDISNHKEKTAEREALPSINQQDAPFDDYLIHIAPHQKHISLNGIRIGIQHRDAWSYTSKNESFSLHVFVIGENILLARMKGKMTLADATTTYRLIGRVSEEMNLSTYYYIEDLSKSLPVSRQTRNKIKKLDSTLEPARIHTCLILPQVSRTMYAIFHTTFRKNGYFSPSVKEAILACMDAPQTKKPDNQQTNASDNNAHDLEKASKDDLIEMIVQLREENTTLKRYQKHRIFHLQNILGQTLWGDSFDFQQVKLSPEDEYYELFEGFSILLKDLQQLVKNDKVKPLPSHASHLIPAIDNMQAMLFSLDPQWRILYCNAAFKNYFKRQCGNDVENGQHLLQMLPESTHIKWENLLKKMGAGKPVQILDDGYFTEADNHFFFTATPLINENSEVVSIVLLAISLESKAMERYEQFRMLSEDTGDLVFLLTTNGLITYIAPSVSSLLGYTQEELTGKSIFRYIHPEDTSGFLSSGHANFFLRDNARVEFRLRKSDHSYTWLEAVSTAVNRKNGNEQYIVVSSREHHEKKQLSVNLRIREEELKSTLEGMSESVYVFDKNGVLVTTNQQKNKDYFIERSCDALIGKAYQEIFAETFIHKLDKAIRIACTIQGKHEFEYIVKREEEEKAPDHYKICVLARKDILGNFAGITMITRNVTASKRLKEQNAALEKANEELDHFVYSASHDLRAPLASTMGLINITRITDDGQEKTNYLNLMEASLLKMDRYIHDITDYSRNARLAIELEKIAFEELIHDVIQTLSYHENTSKIDFLIKADNTIPFYSDYSRLNIIFRNIISNAVKYHDLTRPHPFLSIDIKITPEAGVFRFEDNGIGIEEKYIDKIFDMFYQASPESFGSGLGLYIVKEAMNKLKGSIQAESTPGQGSVFIITLPNHTAKTT